MKKITIILMVWLAAFQLMAVPAWQKLNLTKAAGGTINLNISRMQLVDGKLYAATYDGIWVSPSGNGGDWQPFGLQGEKVTRLSFGNLKLALVTVTASNDPTRTTGVLYKLNGNTWELTNLNPGKLSTFGSASSEFTQIRDTNGKDIILYPTWGGGIWRSDDEGATWTNYTQADTEHGKVFKNVLGLNTFPGDNVVYGTDKVANNDNYLIYSEDYGATWQYKHVGKFFNPHSVFARTVGGKKYLYYGGENGNDGAIWFSDDMGTSWGYSFSMGVEFWQCRKITASPNGNLYSMASVNNLYVSKDNGETFAAAGTGLTIPESAARVSPASGSYFLSDVIATNDKVYLSTIINEGIYVLDLQTGLHTTPVNDLSLLLRGDELLIENQQGATVSIFSVNGTLLKQVKSAAQQLSVSVRELPAGVYLVRSTCNSETSVSRFIIN